MNERKITEEEFQLALHAVDAALGRDVVLPEELASNNPQDFVDRSKLAGLVDVSMDGKNTVFKPNKIERIVDFRFGESVSSQVRRNKMSASGQRVVEKFNNK